ncbi:hypothetical protein K1X76_09940 [bacterium]|nr:hypothetical protein [bacterium]
MNYRHLFYSMSLLAAMSACGGSSSTSTGTVQLKFSVPQTATSSVDAAISRAIDVDNLADYFRNTSFVSGRPDTFSLFVTEIALVDEGNQERVIFQDDDGQEIHINGSHVDLDNLFTVYDCIDNNGDLYDLAQGESCDCGFDSDNNPVGPLENGKCPVDEDAGQTSSGVGKVAVLDIPTGTYSEVKLTFLRTAEIKGCVTGTFTSQADIDDGNSNLNLSNTPGEHTYCTRVDGTANEDFEDQEAETIEVDLGANSDTDGDTMTVEYPINSITLAADETTKLTLFVDTNRLLTYYNQGDDDYVPSNESDVPFFYTPLVQNVMYAFAGHPGSIFGYEVYSYTCTNAEGDEVPEDHVCDDADQYVTNSWLTVVREADGSNQEGDPILINFNTDFGWLNGSNFSDDGLSSSAITANDTDDSRFDLTYTSAYPDNTTFTGTLYNMALDGIDVDESIDDVYFISDGTESTAVRNYGAVTITRRL